jgi:hypothetical protein
MKSFIILLFFLLPLVWSSYVNANYLTTKTFLIYFTSGLALMALPANVNFRQIPRRIWLTLLMIFLYYVSFTFAEGKFSNIYYLFKMLSFASITVYIYSLNASVDSFFDKKISYLFFLMWTAIIAITGVEIFNLRVMQENIQTMAVLSTFGNVNMMSEFFVLCMPFLMLWARYNKDLIPNSLKVIFLFAATFILLYGRSRSAWMGLIAWFIYKAVKREFNMKEYAAFAAAALLFIISHVTAPDVSKISKLTPNAFSERASLYQASAELLLNRPFGIPPGQFMNEIVPYLYNKQSPPAEFAFFDQPHSEFLKWGIQFGWAFLGLCIVFLIFLAVEIYKRSKSNDLKVKKESAFFTEFFIVLFPEMAFQFPFENPASFLLIAVVLGLFLSSYHHGIRLKIKYVQYLLGGIGFVSIINSFIFFTSVHLESGYSVSPDIMNIVCNYHPVNFRACFWRDKGLLETKNIQAFRSEFKRDFRANPFYCDNMRLLPEYFNYGSDRKKTCEALLIYKDLYRQPKHYHESAFTQCAQFRNPIAFENPEQWSKDFKNWFEK